MFIQYLGRIGNIENKQRKQTGPETNYLSHELSSRSKGHLRFG